MTDELPITEFTPGNEVARATLERHYEALLASQAARIASQEALLRAGLVYACNCMEDPEQPFAFRLEARSWVDAVTNNHGAALAPAEQPKPYAELTEFQRWAADQPQYAEKSAGRLVDMLDKMEAEQPKEGTP